jgi:hypothetical protein
LFGFLKRCSLTAVYQWALLISESEDRFAPISDQILNVYKIGGINVARYFTEKDSKFQWSVTIELVHKIKIKISFFIYLLESVPGVGGQIQ